MKRPWVRIGLEASEEKAAALGVRISHWTSSHGVAINVAPDLSHFAGIVPCGVRNYGATSLQAPGGPATHANLDTALLVAWRGPALGESTNLPPCGFFSKLFQCGKNPRECLLVMVTGSEIRSFGFDRCAEFEAFLNVGYASERGESKDRAVWLSSDKIARATSGYDQAFLAQTRYRLANHHPRHAEPLRKGKLGGKPRRFGELAGHDPADDAMIDMIAEAHRQRCCCAWAALRAGVAPWRGHLTLLSGFQTAALRDGQRRSRQSARQMRPERRGLAVGLHRQHRRGHLEMGGYSVPGACYGGIGPDETMKSAARQC